MNSLADKMKLWEYLKKQIEELEKSIEEEVLALGKTQQVGLVSASYSKGRGSYNYEGIAKQFNVSQEVIEKYTSVETKVDWKKLVEGLEISEEIKQQFYSEGGTPSVKIKLLKEE
jgi:hypothetical protein